MSKPTDEEVNEIKGFKVKDKAKVIHNFCCHGFKMGTIVTVMSLDLEDGGVNDIQDELGEEWSMIDYELEKI